MELLVLLALAVGGALAAMPGDRIGSGHAGLLSRRLSGRGLSKDYKYNFGRPPMPDVERLRELATA